MDGKLHSQLGAGRKRYTDMSIWDVHRTQFPWLSFTAPDVFSDVVHSLQGMGEEGGDAGGDGGGIGVISVISFSNIRPISFGLMSCLT